MTAALTVGMFGGAMTSLQMATWRRQVVGADLTGRIHHSDRGVQYRAVRYTQRLSEAEAEAEAVASVGSQGDSYDNAMAEAFNSLYKAELVRNRGPWREIDDAEIATVEYIDWYNNQRLHGELGHVPPAEYEALHAMTHPVTATLETSQSSLHETRSLTTLGEPGLLNTISPMFVFLTGRGISNMVNQVALRPVSEDALSFLNRLTADPTVTSEYQWYGYHDPHRHRRSWEENGLLGDDRGILLVTKDDDELGLVSWHKIVTSRLSYCWNIGIILAPEARGHGHGTTAQRLLVRYLFAHTLVNRIEASTEVDNLAEQRALEKAGFTREGVLRGIGFRAGRWRDGVLYSILRDEIDLDNEDNDS